VKEIVIISGKGGTGKTSLTAAFAGLAEKCVLADCDVDAADLHLLLQPQVRERYEFSGGGRAEIKAEKCSKCGLCRQICRFDAVRQLADKKSFPAVDPLACEGCGFCALVCPADAIEIKPAVNGEWYVSDTRLGPMVHACLYPGEGNSGKLVTLVRSRAREIAAECGSAYILIDGSPGLGCPVIASVAGSDLAVIVTEPTISGEHDLLRIVALTKHFRVPTVVCINRSDINPAIADRIAVVSEAQGLEVVGRIRYDRIVTEAQTAAKTVNEYTDGPVAEEIMAAWRRIITLNEGRE
jgi:MinD superfamily P-loop ATPase